MSVWGINPQKNKKPNKNSWGKPTNSNYGSIQKTEWNSIKDQGWNSYSNKKTLKISLLSKFNIFKVIPYLFEITTNNSTGKFNTEIISIGSGVISQLLTRNPRLLQYHLNINDDINVLKKIELVYQGQIITFTETELPIATQIAKDLDLSILLKAFKINKTNSLFFSNAYPIIASKIKVDPNQSLKGYFKRIEFETFTIQTQKNEYKCNIFGILASSVIRDFLSKNPKAKTFTYDFDDSKNEFQFIRYLFNLQEIELSSENVFALNEIGHDFGIDCIYYEIDSFLKSIEKVSQAIDDQQNIADKIDELNDYLYKIKETKVDFVSEFIIESNWSKTEENVIELAAFILQVAKTDIRLHPYLIDLLVKLDQCDDDDCKLKSLIPFMVKYLMKSFYLDERYVSFIYKLYERELISKEQITKKLNTNYENFVVDSWFLPEKIGLGKLSKHLIFPATLKDINEYKEMRKKGFYDNEIVNALRNDDVDTFQAFITKSGENSLQNTIEVNIFDPIFSKDARLLNYAAACGSIKCFKYLLLNDEKIDEFTFELAVFGGNVELIRIVDNEKLDETLIPGFFKKCDIIGNALNQAIRTHQDDVFDWILEQKILELNNDFSINNNVQYIFTCIENNNAHALIQLIDKGFDIQSCPENYSSFLEKASKNGFYLLTNLLLNLLKKNVNTKIHVYPESTVSFGNISIFKLFANSMIQSELDDILLSSFRTRSIPIIKYYFETLAKSKFKLNSYNIKNIISASIVESSEIFKYIIEKIESISPFSTSYLFEIINNYFQSRNVECIELMSQMIYKKSPSEDFTNLLIKAVNYNFNRLIEFYLQNKFQIDFNNLAKNVFSSVNLDTFNLIMNNIDFENQKILINCIDYAIESRNNKIVKFILENNPPLSTSLIEAVKANNFEIVELLLEKNSSPSFINKKSINGTALIVSVEKNNYKIFKKLMSIPGIDPNIYKEKFITPLSLAAKNMNLDIFKDLIDFYGEKINDQKWQIEKAIDLIVEQNKVLNLSSISNLKTILTTIINLDCIDLSYGFHISKILFTCIENKLDDIFDLLIEKDFVDLNIFDPENGDTVLIKSIQKRLNKITTSLINHPKVDINKSNYDDKTPFIFAVEFQQIDIVDLILQSEKFSQDENNLNLAFFLSDFKMASKFLSFKSLDINFVPHDLKNLIITKNEVKGHKIVETPLIKAIIRNEEEVFDLIIQHPSFDSSKIQFYGALFASVTSRNPYFLNKLLQKVSDDKFDINSHIYADNVSLLIAAINNNASIENISKIMEYPTFDSKKSDIIKAFNFSLNNSSKLMTFLYDFDCAHDHLIDKQINENGSNLLTEIINNSNNFSTTSIEFLLNHGADPNKPDKNNTYPFIKAASLFGNKAALFLIKSNKLNFNTKIQFKNDQSKETTYLHVLATMENTSLIKEILDRNLCDINVTNDLGESPLFDACRKMNVDNVQLFFKYDNLDFQLKNKNGEDIIQVMKKLNNITTTTNNNDEQIEKNSISDKDLKKNYLSELLSLINLMKKNYDEKLESIKNIFLNK